MPQQLAGEGSPVRGYYGYRFCKISEETHVRKKRGGRTADEGTER